MYVLISCPIITLYDITIRSIMSVRFLHTKDVRKKKKKWKVVI